MLICYTGMRRMGGFKLPKLFMVCGYTVYFWSNENGEPIHVHIAEGKPKANGTKVWITMCGKCLLANNHSNIPEKALNNIIRVIEARSDDIIEKWNNFFGEGRFYC